MSHCHDGLADIRVEFLAPAFRVIPSDRTPDRLDVLCEHCKVSARRDLHMRRKFWKTAADELRKLLPKFSRKQKIVASGRAVSVRH